jgi:hypothetical protein
MKGHNFKIIENLIRNSLEQQLSMIHLLESLSQQMDAQSLGVVEKFNTGFPVLQQETQKTDDMLIKQLGSTDIPDHIRQLLKQRNSLQNDILTLLKKIVPKAVSVKSLMASEIRSIKNGRQALSGYKNQTDHQGKIVNRAS